MKLFIVMFSLIMFLTGCADQVKPDDEQMDGQMVDEQKSGVEVGSIDQDVRQQANTLLVDGVNKTISYERDAINDANNVLNVKTFYFELDSSNIAATDAEIIKHHGKYLALNSSASLRIEGHTDERGTREYNVSLGDRRAQAVKRLVMFQGASSDQIVVISYGEEKPAVLGHDDSAWDLNRRAVLVYGE